METSISWRQKQCPHHISKVDYPCALDYVKIVPAHFFISYKEFSHISYKLTGTSTLQGSYSYHPEGTDEETEGSGRFRDLWRSHM